MTTFKSVPSSGPLWPDSFIKNDITNESDESLCADALMAWGNSFMTKEIPKTFGETMAKIAERLNVLGTPESFSKWAKEKGYK